MRLADLYKELGVQLVQVCFEAFGQAHLIVRNSSILFVVFIILHLFHGISFVRQ